MIPSVEPLESRLTPSASAHAHEDGSGVVRVEGTAFADRVTIMFGPAGESSVSVFVESYRGNRLVGRHHGDFYNVTGVIAFLGAGNDDFLNATDVYASVWGGRGDDTLVMSGGAAVLHGGAGNDTLSGYADRVYFDPGPGKDAIIALNVDDDYGG